MNLMRKPAFLAAMAISMIVLLYLSLVAGRAVGFIGTDDSVAKALGIALLVLPALGIWWLIHEWRMGAISQAMASQLEREGRLPLHDGERMPSGRLTEDAATAVFEVAQRHVEAYPHDWAAWFHVSYAYEAARDRSMARKAMKHAATLYREQRRDARRFG